VSKRAPEQLHRREVRNRIMLPMLGGVAVLAGLLLILVLKLNGVQMGIVANCLLTAFILVPTMLICLIPTLLIVAGSVGLWKANSAVARPLRRGRLTAVGYLSRAQDMVPRAAQPVTALQTRLSYVEYLIGRLTGSKPGPDGAPVHEEQTHGSEAQ
jgi:hypothetical protein